MAHTPLHVPTPRFVMLLLWRWIVAASKPVRSLIPWDASAVPVQLAPLYLIVLHSMCTSVDTTEPNSPPQS